MAQFGRALRSGRRGRVFESRHLDQKKGTQKGAFFVVYLVTGWEHAERVYVEAGQKAR